MDKCRADTLPRHRRSPIPPAPPTPPPPPSTLARRCRHSACSLGPRPCLVVALGAPGRYTASLLAVWCGGAVENYDLYPERRTTDDKGRKVAKSRTNVYQLEQRRCGSKGPENGRLPWSRDTHLPAWWLSRRGPPLRTPERSLSSVRACRGLRSSIHSVRPQRRGISALHQAPPREAAPPPALRRPRARRERAKRAS